jgi:hypothetical protein
MLHATTTAATIGAVAAVDVFGRARTNALVFYVFE